MVRKIRRFALPLLGAVLALAMALNALARQTPQELRRKADAYFEEKSYKLAGETYAQLLTADPKVPDKAEIELRILVAEIKAEEWNRAVADAESFPKKYPDTRQEARAQVWRGRLYTLVPHYGYTVGKVEYRGGDVPKSVGGVAPVGAAFDTQDARKVTLSWRRAKGLFERFRREKRINDDDLNEEIQLNFDLAHLMEPSYSPYGPIHALYTEWEIDPKADYDTRVPLAKQVMFLYEQIPYLDSLRSHSDGHNVVLAALGEGGVHSAYAAIRDAALLQRLLFGPQAGHEPRAVGDTRRRMSRSTPSKSCRMFSKNTRMTAEADRVTFTIATWTEAKGDIMEALRLYNVVLGKYPKSRYVSDANAQIQNLMLPNLGLYSAGVNLPGRAAQFTVGGRNVKQVRFTAYKVALEDVYGKAEYPAGVSEQPASSHVQ